MALSIMEEVFWLITILHIQSQNLLVRLLDFGVVTNAIEADHLLEGCFRVEHLVRVVVDVRLGIPVPDELLLLPERCDSHLVLGECACLISCNEVSRPEGFNDLQLLHKDLLFSHSLPDDRED
jgi:hypothetical protein